MGKVLALGESLIRLSSQKGFRLQNATQLYLHYGGAEANVATNLSILNHDVKYATKLPNDSGLTNNIVSQLKSFGVDCEHIIYGEGRLGGYYLEVGSGLRATNVVYDRSYSAISLMEELEWDLEELFQDVTLFHITGITLGLSKNWHKLGVDLIKEAHQRGIKVSFDMNYRSKLWKPHEAKAVFEQVLPYVHYLSAGRLDAIHFMDVEEVEKSKDSWKYYMNGISERYPNLEYIYGTNRELITPNSYIMSGFVWDVIETKAYESKEYRIVEVIDRIGAGDSYAGAILHGFIKETDLQETVEFGMAAAALKHTVNGDVNLFKEEEIYAFMSNTANVNR
ncbi:PfkB family carbohydrate kinase [Aerococcaceae bacterium WGS1372]